MATAAQLVAKIKEAEQEQLGYQLLKEADKTNVGTLQTFPTVDRRVAQNTRINRQKLAAIASILGVPYTTSWANTRTAVAAAVGGLSV